MPVPYDYSLPTELDDINRRVMQLEIERAALERETDKASKDRLERLVAELSDLKEEQAGLLTQWDREKQSIEGLRHIKGEIDRICLWTRATRMSLPRGMCRAR